MTMSASLDLLSRACVVTVGTVQIKDIGLQEGLNVWFQVRRSLRPREPNTCDLRLYGLSDPQRKAIEASTTGTVAAIASKKGATRASSAATVPVIVEAGYAGGTSVQFRGQMRSAQTVTDGPETVTELTTGDGDEASQLARSTASFPSGTTAYTIALQLLDDMGCGQGNLASVAGALKATQTFAMGGVLKGSSLEHLIDLASGAGLEVSIQGGVAQWSPLGKPLGGTAYLLSSTDTNTGLVGSPTIDTKGVLSCKTLLIPGLAPGKAIQVKSKYVHGFYRIVSMETAGDTSGNDWGHEIEAKPPGTGIL